MVLEAGSLLSREEEEGGRGGSPLSQRGDLPLGGLGEGEDSWETVEGEEWATDEGEEGSSGQEDEDEGDEEW